MTTTEKTSITIDVEINATVEKVWNLWTDPKHILNWNNASDDWHTTRAENDLRAGGKFLSRMEAKDGSIGFDFAGEYLKVDYLKQIEYIIGDGRKVQISFISNGNETTVTETFEAEQTHPKELQQAGWQAILNNFKNYVTRYGKFEVLHFETIINAGAEKVYKTMFDENKYAEWTSEFNPSSHYKGSWEKGSKILFLGTDKEGKVGGMVSKIKENVPNKFISIEHLGIVKNGKEITNGPDADEWAGALETYTYTSVNGRTLISVDQDSNQEFKSYLTKTWPGALNKLKSICEE
jgi:uncharacterized protein YndB with AHSA1/START domain